MPEGPPLEAIVTFIHGVAGTPYEKLRAEFSDGKADGLGNKCGGLCILLFSALGVWGFSGMAGLLNLEGMAKTGLGLGFGLTLYLLLVAFLHLVVSRFILKENQALLRNVECFCIYFLPRAVLAIAVLAFVPNILLSAVAASLLLVAAAFGHGRRHAERCEAKGMAKHVLFSFAYLIVGLGFVYLVMQRIPPVLISPNVEAKAPAKT